MSRLKAILNWKRIAGTLVTGTILIVIGALLRPAIEDWRDAGPTLIVGYAGDDMRWWVYEIGDSVALERVWRDMGYGCTLYRDMTTVFKDHVRILGDTARITYWLLIVNPNDEGIGPVSITISSYLGLVPTLEHSYNVKPTIEQVSHPRLTSHLVSVPAIPAGEEATIALVFELSPEAYDNLDRRELKIELPVLVSVEDVTPQNVTLKGLGARDIAWKHKRLLDGEFTGFLYFPKGGFTAIDEDVGIRGRQVVLENPASMIRGPGTCGREELRFPPKAMSDAIPADPMGLDSDR